MGEILSVSNISSFENCVAAGLKLPAGDKRRRLPVFTLQDELARRLAERAAAGVGLAEAERQTKAFIASLWGLPPLLRRFPGDTGQAPQRRAGIAGPLIRMPEIYRGVQDAAAYALYRAAAAHAQAHLVFGGPPFPAWNLEPLPISLLTLLD